MSAPHFAIFEVREPQTHHSYPARQRQTHP